MILIISGTNRPNSKTKVVAEYIYRYLCDNINEEIHFLSLDEVPHNYLHTEMYDAKKLPPSLVDIQDNMIIPSNKWIIVSPEYNGSFPGVLKLFIDAISIRKYSDCFEGKKVALVGVSSGKAGNLRGMEHLTGLLNYLKMVVHPEKLPVSRVEKVLDDASRIDQLTRDNLDRVMNEFIA